MPTPRSVSNIKSKLLRPALTSHFEVSIPVPPGLTGPTNTYLKDNNVRFDKDKLQLLCSEASLPGSNLATLEINNDFTGVTERHVHRRIYDDRLDLTFYVDAENYLPIRFFETWMKYAAGENVGSASNGGRVGSADPTYFYRVRYPKLYISPQGLRVTKFERTGVGNNDRDYTGTYIGPTLSYEFVNTFPISITSMPVSYDTSSLLKCTVSMSYIRYYVTGTNDINQPTGTEQGSSVIPEFANVDLRQAGKLVSPETYFKDPKYGLQFPEQQTKDTQRYFNDIGLDGKLGREVGRIGQ